MIFSHMIHMIFSQMNSYVSWFHIWIGLYQGSRYWRLTSSTSSVTASASESESRVVQACQCQWVSSCVASAIACRCWWWSSDHHDSSCQSWLGWLVLMLGRRTPTPWQWLGTCRWPHGAAPAERSEARDCSVPSPSRRVQATGHWQVGRLCQPAIFSALPLSRADWPGRVPGRISGRDVRSHLLCALHNRRWSW